MGCGSSSQAANPEEDKKMKGVGPSDGPSSARTQHHETEHPPEDSTAPSKAEDNSSPFTSNYTFGDANPDAPPSSDADDTGGANTPPKKGKKTRRIGVSAEPILPDELEKFVPPVIEKSDETKQLLRNVVVHNPLFKALTPDELDTVIAAMKHETFARHHDILTQDEIGSERFYFIHKGVVNIIKRHGEEASTTTTTASNLEAATTVDPKTGLRPNSDEFIVCSFSNGQTFGEMELMYLSPCAATVRVASDTLETYSIDRDTYRHIVMMVSVRKRKLYKELLLKVSWLANLSEYEQTMLADALERIQVPKGETLIKFGDEGSWMFFIISGTVEVIGRDIHQRAPDGTPAKKSVCKFTVGDCVGDLEFLNNHRAVADVVAETPIDVCRLHRDHFELCMGPLKDFLKGHAATDDKFDYYRNLEKGAKGGGGGAPASGSDFASGSGAQVAQEGSGGGDLFAFAFGSTAEPSAFQAFGGGEADDDDHAAGDSSPSAAPPMKPKARRVGVSDESQENDDNWQPPVIPKSPADKELIRRVLRENIILSTLKGADRETLVDAMSFMHFEAGTDILTQGGEGGEYYYVISKGIVDILKQEKFIVSFSEGQGFGEMELMYVQPCVATVRARTGVDTWAIDRKTYKRLVMSVSVKRRELYTSLLKKVEFLELMTEYERLQLADALETVHYDPGQYLIRRGETNDYMYLIISGRIAVYGVDNGVEGNGDGGRSPTKTGDAGPVAGASFPVAQGMRHITDLGPGSCVGELEFLNQHAAVADCMAAEPTTACRLHRDHFELCMGPVTDVLRKTVRQDKYAYYQSQLEDMQNTTLVRQASRVGARRGGAGRARAKAVSAEVDEDDSEEAALWQPPKISKTPQDLATLKVVVNQCPILASLLPEQQAAVVDAMEPVHLKQGVHISTENTLNEHPAWYVVAEGLVTATTSTTSSTSGSSGGGAQKVIGSYGPGASFGELDLMYATPSVATFAVTSSEFRGFRLDRKSYRRLVMKLMLERRALYKELMTGVPFMSQLNEAQQLTMADALSEIHFNPGTALVQAGHRNEWMYIIADGIVEVFDKTGKEKVCDLRRGEMVGELEFLNGHVCVATCVAKTHVHACRLHRQHFQLCMGPVQSFMEATLKHPKYEYYNKTQKQQ